VSLPVEYLDPEGRSQPPIIKTLLADDSRFDRARIRRKSWKTKLMLSLKELRDIP